MKKIPKTLQTVFKLIISLAFFSVLLSFVRGNELVAVFQKISWLWFVFSFIVTVIMLLASCAKWKIILDLKSKQLSYWELLKIYLIGYFFSNILPSTFGGDVVRSYYAGRIIENQTYAAVSVFVERFSGVFFLFLLAAIAPFFRIELLSNPYLYVPACVGLICSAIIVWLCLAKNPFVVPNKLAKGIFSFLRLLTAKRYYQSLVKPVLIIENLYYKILDRLKKLKAEMQVAVDAVKNNQQFVLRLICLTLCFYILTWVNVYTAFRAFHVEVNILAICALVPAIMLVAQVPVTLLGNLGYYESVFVFYFLLVGVDGAETLAMGLFLRLKMLSIGGFGFFVYMVYRQKHRLDLEKGKIAA
ncbi:MAG: flippase-like domain-containing protein [Proteobacteria bacterium]|nr:flippase-like domain-containing protein [Pseudomonadota bacterium]